LARLGPVPKTGSHSFSPISWVVAFTLIPRTRHHQQDLRGYGMRLFFQSCQGKSLGTLLAVRSRLLKVMDDDGVMDVLRTGCQRKMLPGETAPSLPAPQEVPAMGKARCFQKCGLGCQKHMTSKGESSGLAGNPLTAYRSSRPWEEGDDSKKQSHY
jgi:hypothetical protein